VQNKDVARPSVVGLDLFGDSLASVAEEAEFAVLEPYETADSAQLKYLAFILALRWTTMLQS